MRRAEATATRRVHHSQLYIPSGSTVSTITPTGFAVRVLAALSKGYDAIGYVPPGATPEQRAQCHQPVRQAVHDLAACGRLLEDMSRARNRATGLDRGAEDTSRARNRATGLDRGAEGPEGTWPLYQAEALAKTAASVSSVLDAMEAQQLSLEGVKLAAFVNESGTESSFGKADMRTQYSHPDQQHYCERKPAGLTRAINPVVRAPGDVAV